MFLVKYFFMFHLEYNKQDESAERNKKAGRLII